MKIMLIRYKEDSWFDDNTGELYKLNTDTGELIRTNRIVTDVKIGSSIRSREQQNASRKYFEAINKKQEERFLKFAEIAREEERKRLEAEMEAEKNKKPPIELRQSRKPNFFWVYAPDAFNDVTPATATRLILLASMMNYCGQVMRNRKEPMTISDLQGTLKLGRAAVYQFLTECKDYIYTKDNFLYFQDNCKIFKGRLPSCEEFEHYQKVFCKAVRKLFEETDKSKLKQLGYVYQLLPFISLDYNIFCSNPFETDYDKVEVLSTKDFCKLINYDVSNSARLKRDLQKLQFDYNGHKEYLLLYLNTGADLDTERIVVNPHIIYNGEQLENVMKLGDFCKVQEKKPRHFLDKPNLTQKPKLMTKNWKE